VEINGEDRTIILHNHNQSNRTIIISLDGYDLDNMLLYNIDIKGNLSTGYTLLLDKITLSTCVQVLEKMEVSKEVLEVLVDSLLKEIDSLEVREYLKNILNLEFDNFIRCNVMVIPDIVDYIRYFKQGLVSNKLIK
jgi:hypothetical protein